MRGMTRYQLDRHPVLAVLALLLFGPFLLAGALFYVVVYAAYCVLRYVALVGQRYGELKREQR